MKLGVLFSGGKDSTYAVLKAMETDEVVCLISIISENKESFMFHTPNIFLTGLQAEAMGLPLVQRNTAGIKEDELEDMRLAILQAREEHEIEGVVTGAIASVYQAVRVQRICMEAGLWCFNPLWQADQAELLKEISNMDFRTIISGVFAYPFDETWLGRMLDKDTIMELEKLQESIGINPGGEGGEIETTVLDAPIFKRKVEIVKSSKRYSNHAGILEVHDARLSR